jgi:hypothetical protein
LCGSAFGSTEAEPEASVGVDEVKALRTQSGKTRFVLVDESGNEYTTFKEAIARDAIAAEGRRARIEYHEQERNGFTTSIPTGSSRSTRPWRSPPAIEAAPWLLGDAPEGGVDAEEAFDKLRPFKELVAEDIADEDGKKE